MKVRFVSWSQVGEVGLAHLWLGLVPRVTGFNL